MPLLYDEEPDRRSVAPTLGDGVRRIRVETELATLLLSAVNNAHRVCGLEVGDRLSEVNAVDVDGFVDQIMVAIKQRVLASPPPEPPPSAPRADPPAESPPGLTPAAVAASLGWTGLEDQALAVARRLATPGQRDAVRAMLGHRILRLVNNAYRACGIDVYGVRTKDHSDQVHGFVGVILEDLNTRVDAAYADGIAAAQARRDALRAEVEAADAGIRDLVRRRDALRAEVNTADAEIDRRRNA